MAFTSTGGNINPTTKANVGTIESIYDKILLIGADETPLMSLIGTSNVSNIKHAWLIDNLATPSRSPKLEISDFVGSGASTKQKKENAVEIFTDDIMVSKSMEKIATHGGKELPYQTAKKIKEHKLGIEMALLGLGRDSDVKVSVFKAPTVRDEATAGEMAGIFHFLAKGATAFTSGKRGNVLAFDETEDWTGANTVLTWDKFNEILQNAYNAGETPKDVFLGANLKGAINSFVSRQLGNESKYNGVVKSLETDFGTVNIRLHRMLSDSYGLGDTLMAGNFEYMKNGLLYSTEIEDVTTSKTATAKRIYTECTLEVRNADAFVIGVGLKA
jgi:hypothetical protein